MTTSTRMPETKTPKTNALTAVFAVLVAIVLLGANAAHAASKSDRLSLQGSVDKHVYMTEAVFPWAHNAFNSSAHGYWLNPNQDITVKAQLNAGQRFIDLDLEWYSHNVYLCHNGCFVSDDTFRSRLDEIYEWFNNDPERLENEVVVLYLEADKGEMKDSNDDPRFDKAIEVLQNSGVADLVYRPDSACTEFRGLAREKTKADVLQAGKNIILVGAKDSTCNEDDWGTWTYNLTKVERVYHDVVYPMLKLQFDGFPTCKGKTEYLLATTTVHMDSTTEFTYAYNDLWALAPQDSMSVSQMEKMTGCGVNAISYEEFKPESDRHEALIWSWAENEPDAAESSSDNCATSSQTGMADANCDDSYSYVCRNLDNREQWVVTPEYGPWKDGAQTCYEMFGLDWEFSVPANGYQNNWLKVASPFQVWVNYNDIDEHGDWEPLQQFTEAVFDFEIGVDGKIHRTTTIPMSYSDGASTNPVHGPGPGGIAAYFQYANDPKLQGDWDQQFEQNVSISAWIQVLPESTGANQRIVEFSADGTWNSTALILDANGQLKGWCEDETDDVRRGIVSSGTSTYLDNTWHHVAYVHSSMGAELYVDGLLVDQTSTVCQDIEDSKKLTLASYASTNQKLNGALDEVKIFGVALTAADVALLAQ